MLGSLFKRSTTACPYCYQELDVNQVAFRCSGRAAAGCTPCTKGRDYQRELHFNDSTPVLPIVGTPTGRVDTVGGYITDVTPTLAKDSATCEFCFGETRIRVCPECHSMLPFGLTNESPLLGLVGVRNSGKTVYLSVLDQELRDNVAKQFNASIDTPGGQSGLAAELRTNRNAMAQQRRLPLQTASSSVKTPVVYEWKYQAGRSIRSSVFSFYDTAGEDVSNQNAAVQQKYLSQVSGVILLLDPYAFSENINLPDSDAAGQVDTPESTLDAITYVLQTAGNVKRNKKIKVPLAVVVSKIDAFFDEFPTNHPLRTPASKEAAFDDVQSQSIHDHMQALIAKWGGNSLLSKLDMEYETYRIFGVSALGAPPQMDGQQKVVDQRGLLPHRVADPVLWLLAERGFIPTSRG